MRGVGDERRKRNGGESGAPIAECFSKGKRPGRREGGAKGKGNGRNEIKRGRGKGSFERLSKELLG